MLAVTAGTLLALRLEVTAMAAEPPADSGDVAASEPAPVEALEFGEPSPAAEPIPVPDPNEATDGRVRASLDGFGLESASGRFGLSLGLLGQVRYSVDHQDGDLDNAFSLRLARTMLQGHMFGQRLLFQLQPEFAGNVRLLDANVTVNLHPAFSVLVGQYRPWFTRAFPTNLPLQAQLDRGAVLDAFRIDRDIGVTVLGQPFDGRLEYYVGVLNGEGLELSAPRSPQPLVTARVVANPLGPVAYDQTVASTTDRNLPLRLAIGASAATNEVARTGTMVDPMTGEETIIMLPRLRTVTAGGELALQWWRLVGLGEVFWRGDYFQDGGRGDAWGGYGTLSLNAVRKRFDVVARVGAMRLEGETSAHMPLEPGMNLYFAGNHAKLQLRYRCDLGLADAACITQGVHLQGQFWF